jgi:hypothetical protein
LSIFNLGKIDGPGIPVYLRGEFIVSRKGVHDESVLLQNLHQVLIDPWGSTSLEFQVLKPEPCSVKLEIIGPRIAIPKSLNHLTPWPLEPAELTDLILFSDLCEEKEEKEALALMMATMKHNRLRPRIGSRSSPPRSPPKKPLKRSTPYSQPAVWPRAAPLGEAFRWILLASGNWSPIKAPDRNDMVKKATIYNVRAEQT